MSAIQILDGVTDISAGIDWTTVDLVAVLTKENGSLKFDIMIPNPSSPPSIPVLGDTMYMYYNSVELFGGTCTELETVIDGGTLQRVHVTCSDWGFAANSKVVNKSYVNMDPADIVLDLVTNFFPAGFNATTYVQRGNFLVSSIKFNYEQATKALQALAQQIDWDWYIDPQKNVHFFFADTSSGSTEILPAPFNITDTGGQIQFNTLDVDISIANMKNSIYVIGGTMFRLNTAGNTPDLYTTVAGQLVYPIAYPYDTSNIVGGTLQVTLNGVNQTIGISGQDQPGTVDVLYSQGAGGGAQGGGPFIQFTSDPGGGNTLEVFGNSTIPIVAHVSNQSSIGTYGEQQDSIIDKQITSVQEAQARAEAEINQFGHPVYDVKFSTLVQGLAIGQLILLNSVLLGISNYPLIIKRIEATGYSPTALLFAVEALGSNNVTFNDIMMTLLQQSLATNVIPDNTILQEVLAADEGLILTDTVAATSATGPYKWAPGSPQIRWNFWKWK